MKICTKCEFHDRAPTQVGPQQMVMVDICRNSECANPVNGEPLPCGQARSNQDLCGLHGKRYKEKVEEKPKTDQVIQLVRP